MEPAGSVRNGEPGGTVRKAGLARHSLGIMLLMCVVFLWTASNFLASNILADDSYSHPFFITYVNTSFFIVFLIVVISRRIFGIWSSGNLGQVRSWRAFLIYIDSHDTKETFRRDILEPGDEEEYNEDGPDDAASIQQRQGLLRGYREDGIEEGISVKNVRLSSEKLGLKETARLAAQFCLLWFAANYFALACLQYTTVGSTTILTSTSGVWTLIFGAIIGVEKFTMRKCLGVLASLAGVILISSLDMSSSSNDEVVLPPTLAIRSGGSSPGDGDDRGSFPNKTPAEIALGDAMAAFSAIIYGIYTIVMKKQVGDESRVNMQLFFGLVGFFNVFFLWPGFIVLHLTGIERFSLPSEDRIWVIILINSISSLVSDICWAYAMLLTSPLVVTVGLSLTIPLSLVGQIVLQGEYASVLYWIGALVVLLSFLIVNHESKGTEQPIVFDESGGGGHQDG
ncbi:putative vacuolar membrane protein YML018C [Talaromyces islandicus]|uniref:Putative vacuolar membrane protein YML018C n=1 Tax=Talaromyces islandicus TaxID=28573 RepID=A0A0U1LLW4_TALIS|nr:putative vacuolar membrane protein YML018C [Talaromyces islandicus]